MVSSRPELIDEVREFGQYTVEELTDDEINTAINRAQKHLLAEADQLDDPDWWDDDFPHREEALFWTAMLFSKVGSGELDSKTVSVAAIKEKSLLANGDEVTFWYSQYQRTKSILVQNNSSVSKHRNTSRTSQGGSRRYGR